MTESPEYRIQPEALKDPGESLKVSIDLYDLCAVVWRPNEDYSSGEFIRPLVPNGFSYEVTTGGRSGASPPRFPTTIGNTVPSGSAILTCRASSAGGVNPITSPSASSDPTGLTVNSVAAAESHKITATYVGGTEGQDYDVVYSFTLDGVTRIARQKVQVRKR